MAKRRLLLNEDQLNIDVTQALIKATSSQTGVSYNLTGSMQDIDADILIPANILSTGDWFEYDVLYRVVSLGTVNTAATINIRPNTDTGSSNLAAVVMELPDMNGSGAYYLNGKIVGMVTSAGQYGIKANFSWQSEIVATPNNYFDGTFSNSPSLSTLSWNLNMEAIVTDTTGTPSIQKRYSTMKVFRNNWF